VVETALNDIRATHPGKPTQDQRESVAWVLDGSKDTGSFEWVCDMLGIGCGVRFELRRLAQNKLTAPSIWFTITPITTMGV
jgi:hypothetical protein